MITFQTKGDFKRTLSFLNRCKKIDLSSLDRFGQEGVEALQRATPKDTGLTADSWYYEIVEENGSITVRWLNSNVVNDWCNVAIILQYGHATGNGGYVEGIDYINPALHPVFDKIAKNAWKEVIGG